MKTKRNAPKPHIKLEGTWWKCRSEKRRGVWFCSDTPKDAYEFWLSRRKYEYRQKVLKDRGLA